MASRPVIIITAANQGLGHEALKALAPANKYHLVAAARSQSKADKAVKVIASEIGSNPINFTPVVIYRTMMSPSSLLLQSSRTNSAILTLW